jgi:hypothetical protein
MQTLAPCPVWGYGEAMNPTETATIVGRYNFIHQAEKAAAAQSRTTGDTYGIEHDRITDTYLVIRNP